MGPDGKPVARISDGSGLNNLPGVFGGALAPEPMAEDSKQGEGQLGPNQLGSRPGSPHQNALRKRCAAGAGSAAWARVTSWRQGGGRCCTV